MLYFINRFTNYIQWNFFRKKKYLGDDISDNILNSLEKNSYYVYKNFLDPIKLSKLRKELQNYSRMNESLAHKTTPIYFRSRLGIPLDKPYLKVYIENNIIKTIIKKFKSIRTCIRRYPTWYSIRRLCRSRSIRFSPFYFK